MLARLAHCTHACARHVDLAGPWPLGASRVVFVPSTTLNCSSLNVFAEMFMPAKPWYQRVSRDLLIHALDHDGYRVILTCGVVEKLVSAFRGKMMAIEVMGKQSVILRFSFGYLDFGTGVWTHDPLPWKMKFMDLGAGSVMQTNEK